MISNQYEAFMQHVYFYGIHKMDRTGTGTKSVFGYQMRFDLTQGFPLVTTKKVHTKAIVHELLWFLKGSTNIQYLHDNGVSIWDEWADEDGNLGPVYGAQWRSWPGKVLLKRRDVCDAAGYNFVAQHYDADNKGVVAIQEGIDQISNVIDQLRKNPDSRRLIVSAWNPAEVDQMALPPCHALFQFYTRELTLDQRIDTYHANNRNASLQINESSMGDDQLHKYLDSECVPRRYLDCQLYQRSADIFLGVPFNIASYSLLTHMVAQQVGMIAGEFIWTGGDCHLYDNHKDQVALQLSREPYAYAYPQLKLNKAASIFDYKFEDVEFLNYQHHDAIKAPIAV